MIIKGWSTECLLWNLRDVKLKTISRCRAVQDTLATQLKQTIIAIRVVATQENKITRTTISKKEEESSNLMTCQLRKYPGTTKGWTTSISQLYDLNMEILSWSTGYPCWNPRPWECLCLHYRSIWMHFVEKKGPKSLKLGYQR